MRSALAQRLLSVVPPIAHTCGPASLFLLLGAEIEEKKAIELEAEGQRGLWSRVEVCTGRHGGCKIRGSRCVRSATAATLCSSNGGMEWWLTFELFWSGPQRDCAALLRFAGRCAARGLASRMRFIASRRRYQLLMSAPKKAKIRINLVVRSRTCRAPDLVDGLLRPKLASSQGPIGARPHNSS